MENYEQKYKEMKKRVLAIGQGYVKEVDYSSPRSIAEYIDPDLKESEDERIVKELISFLKEEEAKADITSKRSKTLCKYIVWLEKQSTPQVRTGPEWVTMIDDACDKRYSEEYAHGEYCHEQSFKWGFQEGVDWLEKQGGKVDVLDDFPTEFERQISHLIASSINKEWEYKKDFVKHTANALLQYAKNELEKQGEQSDYNPYKATVESIASMVEKYANGGDLEDFYNNIKVKCKDVMEYDKIWTEKQGEQKPADKVEPKFKVGDTIVEKDLDEYDYETIKDIKDGQYIFTDGYCMNIDEQEGWQLVKTIVNIEQNFSWSKEDELMIQDAIHWINEFQKSNRCKDESDMQNSVTCENWLKSLKDRVKLQLKPSWSEEDEKKIMWLVRLISTAGFRELDNDKMPCSRSELLDWLKSIKPNHWKPSEQNIKDLEWCADLVKDKMGVGFHRLQVFIDEIKKL